jgi:hypothetical protein
MTKGRRNKTIGSSSSLLFNPMSTEKAARDTPFISALKVEFPLARPVSIRVPAPCQTKITFQGLPTPTINSIKRHQSNKQTSQEKTQRSVSAWKINVSADPLCISHSAAKKKKKPQRVSNQLQMPILHVKCGYGREHLGG